MDLVKESFCWFLYKEIPTLGITVAKGVQKSGAAIEYPALSRRMQ
jgi:hypothetical protein